MFLIFAIEPDKRQSSQLASLVKGQLHAELVQRANAADGLTALQGRVPDLVLTSSLISPRDDAALATHLRELGAAAAHVQTVTIPLLGTAAPASRVKSGVLAALRREKPQPAMTDGCAPEVFAEQIRQYLATAEQQKAAAASRALAEPEVAGDEPAPVAEVEVMPAQDEVPAPYMEFAPAEPEAVADAPADTSDEWLAAPGPAMEPVAEVVDAAAPEAVDETVVDDEPFVLDEPAGLPLSQLLQLVSDRAPRVEAPRVDAIVETAPFIEMAAVAEPEPIAEPEPVPECELVVEPEPMVAAEADLADLHVDPVAAQALDELSRQAPPPSLGDSIPGEAPVPVVEMHSFQSLDSIANELAAGPSRRHESLDDLASLFVASPAPTQASEQAAAAAEPAALEVSGPLHAETNRFASLFAEPAPAPAAKVIEVPGIDPSLFAAAPEPSVPALEPPPLPLATAFEIKRFDAVEPVLLEAEPEPRPEPVFFAAPAPVPEPEPEPLVMQAAIEEPAVAFAPEPEIEPVVESVLGTFEPMEWEPEFEEPVAVAAAPAFDEEIALDVDAFAMTMAPEPAAPAAPAEPSRFSFTFVDSFGDALSEFEVAAIAAPANSSEPLTAPALDDEALSLIGDAAHKMSLDSTVIEEFERSLPARRAKKAKKKPHVGATQVAPASERSKSAKRPVQDEWGMFDPEQAGFAALEDEEATETRPTTGTRVRVISY